MDLSLAGRHDHYEGINKDANVPKVTFRYQPIKDLTLRASFANSFVAPNLYQLYGPASVGFTGAITLRYLRLTRLGQLHAEARITRRDGVKTFTAGHLADDEGITVEADGVFIQPRWARD